VKCGIRVYCVSLRLIICAYYLWKIVLNVAQDTLFDDTYMTDNEIIRDKSGEVNSRKHYVINGETSCRNINTRFSSTSY
jgi:hypothetical protein